MSKSRKLIASTLAIMLIVGCAGRTANLVMVQQIGDSKKSCKALEIEMAFAQSEIQRLTPQTNKAAKNVILGITGFFLIIPLFFMDLGHAEQMEIDAFRRRYNQLSILHADKDCDQDKSDDDVS